MSRHWVEHRDLYGEESLSWDIARHYSTSFDRKATVVTSEPGALFASVSKKWRKAIRQAMRERSSTLDSSKVYGLTKQIAAMQAIRMSAQPPTQQSSEHIDMQFLSVAQALELPPVCQTLYVAVPIDDATLAKLKSRLPGGALIVLYRI